MNINATFVREVTKSMMHYGPTRYHDARLYRLSEPISWEWGKTPYVILARHIPQVEEREVSVIASNQKGETLSSSAIMRFDTDDFNDAIELAGWQYQGALV